MSIEIKGMRGSPVDGGSPGKGLRIGNGTTAGNAPSAAGGTDRVSLTDAARTLRAAASALERAPIVDVQHVTQVRSALAEGTYTIDVYQVADKLIQFEGSLFGLQESGNPSYGAR